MDCLWRRRCRVIMWQQCRGGGGEGPEQALPLLLLELGVCAIKQALPPRGRRRLLHHRHGGRQNPRRNAATAAAGSLGRPSQAAAAAAAVGSVSDPIGIYRPVRRRCCCCWGSVLLVTAGDERGSDNRE